LTLKSVKLISSTRHAT